MTIPRVDESLYINGAWRRASGEAIDLFDPTDGHVIASVRAHHAGDLENGIGGEDGKWG
jgi:acyl-CoA reductase-like NAD-dependent aldehyde dehydrogenase